MAFSSIEVEAMPASEKVLGHVLIRDSDEMAAVAHRLMQTGCYVLLGAAAASIMQPPCRERTH